MNSVRKFGMIALALLLSAGMASAVSVTFQLDMSIQAQLGEFDAATDSVGINGTVNNWDNGNPIRMHDDDEDMIYTATVEGLTEGDPHEYKYVIAPDANWASLTWENLDNRTFTTPAEDTTFDVQFFNDQNSVNPQFDYEMIFQVDMSVAIQTGDFDPDNDAVVIRGNNAAIGNWGGFTQLVQEGATDIYTAFIEFDQLQVDTNLEWKYVIDVDNDGADPLIWEELPGGGNRIYVPTGDEPDSDDNGRLEVMFDVVYWANNPGGIDEELTVTYELDGRPAMRKQADVGIPNIEGEVDFFIITGPWDGTGWLWTNGELSTYNLYDDGVAPDAVAGDSTFTTEITFPAGTSINFTYKYGAEGYDNESDQGENHFTELNSEGGTQVIADEFGSIGDLYDDYLVVLERPVAQLPTEFIVGQNYPNPFNPTTNIDFTLPAPGETMLRVYNIAGQEVISRNMGNLNAGAYQVQLDASSLSSGVYFYRLEANGLSATKKMMLMK